MYDSEIYSEMTSIKAIDCENHQEFVIEFTGNQKNVQGDAIVKISFAEKDLDVLKFDVKLFGIPENQNVGQEVTVNFHAPELKNNGVFYTDSNGLEMLERRLN